MLAEGEVSSPGGVLGCPGITGTQCGIENPVTEGQSPNLIWRHRAEVGSGSRYGKTWLHNRCRPGNTAIPSSTKAIRTPLSPQWSELGCDFGCHFGRWDRYHVLEQVSSRLPYYLNLIFLDALASAPDYDARLSCSFCTLPKAFISYQKGSL